MPIERFGYTFRDGSDASQRIVERDGNSLSSSYTRSYGLVVDKGQGALLWDKEGNEYIDFAAGIAVMSTGYGHPRIVDAVKRQVERFVHIGGTDFFYEEQVAVAESLQEIIPIHHADNAGDKRVFLANSGTEAVEAALKLARYRSSKRTHIIAFYGAFHGRSYGALSVTASKSIQRANYPHIPGGVVHVPYPGKFDHENSKDPDSLLYHPAKFIEKYVFAKKVPASEVAAIIVEPIQGEGGYILPTDSFLRDLRELCDQHDILLIVDEIQSGMGRTGRWLAIEHWDVKPDIVCLAKGLGSGVPIGAIVAHRDVMTRWISGAHASTFGGNPLACEVARTTIEIIKDENLLQSVTQVGKFAIERLREMQKRHPFIKRIEGKGLMIGVEFADQNGNPIPRFRDRLVDQCFLNGLVTLGCGASTLRIAPPLVITKDQISAGLQILDRSLSEVISELTHDDMDYEEQPGIDMLIVDPDASTAEQIRQVFAESVVNCNIAPVTDYEDALRSLHSGRTYEAIIIDVSAMLKQDEDSVRDLLAVCEHHADQHDTVVLGYSNDIGFSALRVVMESEAFHDVIGKHELNALNRLREQIEVRIPRLSERREVPEVK